MITTKIISIAFTAIAVIIQVISLALLSCESFKKYKIGRALLLSSILISTVVVNCIFHWM